MRYDWLVRVWLFPHVLVNLREQQQRLAELGVPSRTERAHDVAPAPAVDEGGDGGVGDLEELEAALELVVLRDWVMIWR